MPEAPLPDAPSCSCAVDDRRIPLFVLDNLLRRLLQPPRRFLARHVRAGDRAADLGCGPGHFTVPMAQLVGEDGRVVAVDFDDGAVAHLRRKLGRRRLETRVDARVASAAEVDFIETDSLDFVLAEGLICCMVDHHAAVAQIERVLRPGGRAWLSVMKGGRSSDPRSVSRSEWEGILGQLEVHASGQGLLSRWALVGPKDAASTPRTAVAPGRA